LVAQPTVIWWMRRDLRLGDNPALGAAAEAGRVLPVFVFDDRLWGPSGDNRRVWLLQALAALDEEIGHPVTVRHGDPAEEIAALARETETSTVFAAADFGPYGRRRDDAVARALAQTDVELQLVGSPYAVDPGTVVNGSGQPYKVFTPFSRAWREHGWDRPVGSPARLTWEHGPKPGNRPAAPVVDAELPPAGEKAALARWHRFVDDHLDDYDEARNLPAADATSHLSVDLKWGVVHPRTLLADLPSRGKGADTFRTELCWRDFYADVLWRHPDSTRHALQSAMAGIKVDAGKHADERFAAWAEGRTGYPIVDAGMRQLLATGWMHNRVRMITASFLVKDLHLEWTRGARHFMAHLVDGDVASNSHGWQWVAGTGTDAAPYFRIFNPVTQGRKFDPDGAYIRRWVPELGSYSDKDVHAPWEAADVPLGAGDYPAPVVDHKAEREEALARYSATRT
jgi:deoxyribodipyrimidine photo-lyase